MLSAGGSKGRPARLEGMKRGKVRYQMRSEDRRGPDPVGPWGPGARVWIWGFKKLTLAAVSF